MEVTKEEISKVAAFLMHLGQGFANLSLGLKEVEQTFFGRQIEETRGADGSSDTSSNEPRIEDGELGSTTSNSPEGV